MKIEDCFGQFRRIAERYFKKGYVGELIFSGRTYQVQVFDEKSCVEAWPFLQFSKEGYIKDCFCPHCEMEELSACEHLAVAYLRIYNGHLDPLHLRFKESLWNQLCEIYAFKLGYGKEILKKMEEGHYIYESRTGKPLFLLRAKSPSCKRHLFSLIEERAVETEETSLKFSQLSQEEITLWREGRPKVQLRYELSFWSDLAKYLMYKQEIKEPYKISFRYGENKLPNQIWIEFEELLLAFYISQASLPSIIPSLSTVDSPLPVYGFNEEAIEKISYDKRAKCLLIDLREELIFETLKESKLDQNVFNYRLGDWLYVQGKGFYFRGKHSLLDEPCVEFENIPEILDEHLPIIKRHLVGVELHEKLVQAQYDFFFDEKWNLHLNCYIHQKGDLQKLHSAYFKNWAYVDGDGFYRLENAVFDTAEKIIFKEDISKFVYQNRSWLGTQEGFHTHLSIIEDQLIYFLNDKEGLCFESRVDFSGENRQDMDFGDWVYFSGQGFYAKTREGFGGPVRPGVRILKEEISNFIKMNREDLEHVRGFFNEQCPVNKAGLEISLKDGDTIIIAPRYELLSNYCYEQVSFYGDFVYVDKKGFHELPIDTRLPEEFCHQTVIRGDRMGLFLTYELEKLKSYAYSIDKRLSKGEKPCFTVHQVMAEETLEKGEGLIFEMSYSTNLGSIPVTEIWHALRSKRRYLFSRAGLIDLNEERFRWIRHLSEQCVDVEKGRIKIGVLEFLRLNAFEDVEDLQQEDKQIAKGFEFLNQLRELRVDTKPDFKGLLSRLRPYQEQGVNWLWFLYNHQLSGLLCDDMGLGKTHQAMALICAIVNERPKIAKKRKYFLVVCPTSVIYHWQEKFESFLPKMRVRTFHGVGRNLDGFLCHYDILLTSYGILRREKEMIRLISFELAVFDEIQVAKNHLSKVHSSLLAVQSKMCVGLTGTPIENQIRELKSLFDVVLPMYMPSEEQYRNFFIHPIEKEGDEEKKKLLSRFIHPFLLRRKKEEVLQDLPEKVEEVAHCELTEQQRGIYRDILQGSHKNLIADLMDESKPIAYIHIFSILMKLKQLCDHPALVLKDIDRYHEHSSGKWQLFVELINQARESGQKVVVFSQYLGMLDIIEKYLKDHRIKFASLRGGTVDRAKEMQTFQKDPQCVVFVASLLAAGLGIDLTAASIVIHYDRWWNAAREKQATDRVHRIGQTRGVQVFKLVTLGTLEEKIDRLIARKGKLMEEVIGSDESGQLKKFSRKELVELLEFSKG